MTRGKKEMEERKSGVGVEESRLSGVFWDSLTASEFLIAASGVAY